MITEIQKYRNWQLFKWLGWVLLSLFLLLKTCESNETITATIPEKKGKFEAVKPNHEPIGNIEQFKKPTIRKNLSNADKSKKEIDFLQSEIDALLQENKTLIDNFSKAPDTVKKTEYAKAIQLNEFSQTYNDSLVNIKAKGLVRGTVEKLGFEYKIKEQKIKLPIKKKIGVYLGSEIGINKDLNQFTYKANLGIQNKKGNIYRASYQRINNQDFGLIGFDLKIL